jgi:hypothetical protein
VTGPAEAAAEAGLGNAGTSVRSSITAGTLLTMLDNAVVATMKASVDCRFHAARAPRRRR